MLVILPDNVSNIPLNQHFWEWNPANFWDNPNWSRNAWRLPWREEVGSSWQPGKRINVVPGLNGFLIFDPIWDDDPNWLICFRKAETTNQNCLNCFNCCFNLSSSRLNRRIFLYGNLKKSCDLQPLMLPLGCRAWYNWVVAHPEMTQHLQFAELLQSSKRSKNTTEFISLGAFLAFSKSWTLASDCRWSSNME